MTLDVTKYPDLPALMKALKERHHGGKLYPMAAKVGVALGTVQQWENGLIRHPSPQTMRLLADAYGLDFGALIDLTSPPVPKRARRLARTIRGVAALAALLWAGEASALGAQGSPAPLLVVAGAPGRDIMSTFRLLRRRLWYVITGWTTRLQVA